MRKTICVDARMIKNSGIGVYVRHFVAKLLSDDELKVILIGRKEELKPFFDLERLDYIEANFPIYSIAEQLRLPKLIPNCDLFWAPHYNVPLLPINSKRFLVTVPDVFHLAFCKTLSIKQQIYAKVVLNIAVRISNKIITISNYSKEEILQYTNIEESKVSVIHLGINKSKFFRRDDLARQWVVRKRYNIPEKYILFVGNVKPNKNLRSLVKAFSLLKDRLPDHKLLIAGKKEGFITGDGQLFDEINNNSLLQERVAFTGYVTDEDLPYLYSMASLFAFPSIYEGFGFPPLEAMACGCAVIASNLASIPEVCGDAAVYVDPYDAEQFAAEIYRITNDHMLEADLILKGYRQVEKYSWDVAENAFMVEIRKLLQ